jgi:prevent-host-death family protein
MSAHSVAEAKNRLSQLIDRALEGHEVVITRHGHPVIVLKPVGRLGRRVSAADLDWLAEHRVGRAAPIEDAGALLTSLRDEDER